MHPEEARVAKKCMLKVLFSLETPFTSRYMYKPWSHRVTLSHDSYSCKRFTASDLEVRPFPSRREEEGEEGECNYVGSPCAARQGGGVRSNIDTGDPAFVSMENICFWYYF